MKTLKTDNYKALFYKSPLGVFTATLKGTYLEVNDTLAFMLEYNSNKELLELIDVSNEVYAIEGERERFIKELLSKRTIITKETSFKKKNNEILPVRINLNLVEGENQEDFVVGLVEDISQQVNSHRDILHEKQTLVTLIENLPDYIYFKDVDGNIQIANKSVRDLLNQYNNQKPDNHSNCISELFHGDDEILKNGGKIPERLLEILDSHNEKQYLSIAKYPVGSINETTGLICIGRNLTELKKAEKKIVESEANLDALIESSHDFIWSVDTKFRLITFNSSFARFIKSRYEIVLTPFYNSTGIFSQEYKGFWENIYRKTLKGEQQFEEFSFIRNGTTFYFECSLNPIFDKSLNISGISVILTDISKRKLAEQALRESEERFRQLAENTSDAFILWDQTGVLYANPSFEKIFGLRINDIMHNNCLIEETISEEDRTRFIKNRKKEISGKPRTRNQHYIIKRKRTSKLVWARHFPVYNLKGKIYRYVTVTSDLTEQKQLEEVLIKTRSQQQALLDNIPFHAWLKDKKGRYTAVNTPFADHHNLKPEDIIGKTDFELFDKEEIKSSIEVDKKVFQTGEKIHIEKVMSQNDLKEWIEIYRSPIFNEKREVIGLTGISREITDRKQLEETIIKNEEHFKALLQYSSDAITILDRNAVITFESSLRNRILNFTVEELIGKSFRNIIHPEDIHLFDEAFHHSLINPGIQIKKEYRSLHKNKRWIYVESILSNHLNNPAIEGIVVNTRDISDRKMSELKEKAYHNNLIFLSNSALELLSISDRDDIFKFIADKLFHFLEHAIVMVSAYDEEKELFIIKQIAGKSEYTNTINEVVGRNPEGITFKKYKSSKIENAGSINIINDPAKHIESQEVYNPMAKILEQLKVNKIYNITLVRNNKLLGSIGIVTLNKTIIKFKHIIETFAHQVAVALHRSQLEYELVAAKVKAEESDRLKTAFLANMSHEIRTPMNGILGFAEMLNDDSIEEVERKKYIDVINSNGKILINLIDDIIDFAKIEAGQIKISKQDFSLNNLLDQVYNTFLGGNFKNEKEKVELTLVKGLEDEDCSIRTDPNRLRQIITNLIGNAFKFTNNGFIEFGYKLRPDNFLEFYVKDSGIGIEPEKLTIIFDRFVQADNSRSRKYSGSGLGLAISKGFSDLLGGQMWATSEFGQGATFNFTIPYVKVTPEKKTTQGQKKAKSTYNWADKNILIAEDDFFSFKFLEGFLAQTQAKILHADDGLKAVNFIKERDDIDIILMDVQMPEMNGLEATRSIKSFKPGIPIIAQTANAITEEKQRCFEAGFDDFVTKPVNIAELFAKIEHWLTKISAS